MSRTRIDPGTLSDLVVSPTKKLPPLQALPRECSRTHTLMREVHWLQTQDGNVGLIKDLWKLENMRQSRLPVGTSYVGPHAH